MNNSTHSAQAAYGIPLLVDFDGSLVKTDSLHECLVLLIKKRPWLLLALPFWWLKGKQHLKHKAYLYAGLNIESLPYRKEVIDYLIEQRKAGRHLILCTGCWYELAQKVNDQLKLFDELVATTRDINLTGKDKAEWAKGRFGDKGFDYLGNHKVDLLVWRHARNAIVIGDRKLVERAECVTTVEVDFSVDKATLKTYLKAIRIHQWAKNALLFIPLLTAHKLGHLPSVVDAILAFISFGLCASATYLLNDLLDLEADRQHPKKSKRPMASGLIPIPVGMVLAAFLLIAGLAIAVPLASMFLVTLLTYLVATVLYSFKLKSLQTVDVITLACLFTLRVIAGAFAIDVSLSFWLLSFSMFLFLSLAIVKRVSELIRVESENRKSNTKISGRGYSTSDANILQSLGSSAGLLSVLVFALYVNSSDVALLYEKPKVLWLMCPFIGYWIMRIWMLAARGEMNEDPISFALTDKISWGVAVSILAIIVIAGII